MITDTQIIFDELMGEVYNSIKQNEFCYLPNNEMEYIEKSVVDSVRFVKKTLDINLL